MCPGRPMRHDVGIRDQDARRIGMGAHDGDRLARLDDQRLVRLEVPERRDDAVEILPCPRRTPDAAIDHKLVRVFGNVRMKVVHQHAQGRLGLPALRVELGAGGRIDVAQIMPGVAHVGGPFASYSARQFRAASRMASSISERCGRNSVQRPGDKSKGGVSDARWVRCASSIWIAWMPASGRP